MVVQWKVKAVRPAECVQRVAREEVSGQPKEKRRKVVPEEGDVSSRSPPTRQQWGKNEGGKSRSQTAGGDTSARKKASEEGATAQRSVTSHQGASTSQGRGQRTDASEIKVEVDVLMKLKNGGSAITKYRVGCLTPMQSVIKKVSKLSVVTFVLVFLML